jgi:hypothetical protein
LLVKFIEIQPFPVCLLLKSDLLAEGLGISHLVFFTRNQPGTSRENGDLTNKHWGVHGIYS